MKTIYLKDGNTKEVSDNEFHSMWMECMDNPDYPFTYNPYKDEIREI